jgi:16S rRNA (adenine1518-N6/adenine1519-N6)-dimethyltransferase
MVLVPIRSPQELLRGAGLRAKKSWGQNFLCDATVLADIAAATEAGPSRPVVELGAGLGALTHHLLEAGGPVVAVERDREIVPHLREYLGSYPGLSLREADAARLDYAALAVELGGPLRVVGNLPYQLSSRILVSLADARPHVHSVVVLIQREVAERLAAFPPGRTYGLLSVLVQRAFTVEVLRIVPPGAFHPRPQVHSAVVRLCATARAFEPEVDRQLVAAARAAFSARRKTLRNSLAGACRTGGAQAAAAIEAAALSPDARAETLGLADFERLGAALMAHGLMQHGAP